MRGLGAQPRPRNAQAACDRGSNAARRTPRQETLEQQADGAGPRGQAVGTQADDGCREADGHECAQHDGGADAQSARVDPRGNGVLVRVFDEADCIDSRKLHSRLDAGDSTMVTHDPERITE
jgi:hypothetical protein